MSTATMNRECGYAEAVRKPAPWLADSDAGTGAKRILIVEDDPDIVRGMSVRLRARGFKTLEAYDGQEGLGMACEQHPDAIVLDVRMPRMDGLTTLCRLHDEEYTRNIPVIMLSASLADQQAALDAGARFFLKKPYQNDLLLAAIDTAIDESANRSEGQAADVDTSYDSHRG